MAPEYPPGLVIFNARFQNGELVGELHYVEVPLGERLRVRWEADSETEGFRPVGGGVAHVLDADRLQVLPVSPCAKPDDLGNLRYRWVEGLKFEIPWIMFILVLPHGWTIVEAAPRPARAKIFDKRLALYWILKGGDVGRTTVECQFQTFDGNASSKLVELNRFCAGYSFPSNPVIQIDDQPTEAVRSSTTDDSMAATNIPKAIFISYAHEDNESSDRSRRWLDRLKQFLQPLVEQDELTVCSDQDIGLGDDWHGHIQKHLEGARAAVLLISPAFLASKYVRSSELPVLLRNANGRGVKIIPVIVRRCLFEETKFKYPDPKTGPEEFTLASLQAPNSPTEPLNGMTEAEQDEVLLKVARALLKLVSPNPR